MTTSQSPSPRTRSLGLVLTALFVLAMVMGSGPGLRFINPDPADPDAVFTIWGLPILYVWGLAWYGIQLVAILTAYTKLWSDDGEEEEGGADSAAAVSTSSSSPPAPRAGD